MRSRALTALAVACLGLAGVSLALAAPGARDPFFPGYGSDAYDVSAYRASLAFTPSRGGSPGGRISARVRVEARAKRRLERFSLDLVGLRVTSVTVAGESARVRRRGHKVIVTPGAAIEAGAGFDAVVKYRGRPSTVTDPDGSREGWFATSGSGAVAVGEPVGTSTWLACNNSLTDKASLDISVSVPRGGGPRLVGVANGLLRTVTTQDGRRTWRWRAAEPMAPYLATIAIGDFRLTKGTAAGVRTWTAIDRRWLRSDSKLGRRARRIGEELPRILSYLQRQYGPYPFAAAGSIVAAVEVGYALETQTRPFYPGPPSRNIIVHEMAHQWFGDSVGLRRWPDIWLNEGFATISEWIYREHHGGPSVRAVFDRLRRASPDAGFWKPAPARPGSAKNLFDPAVYVRGAMALEALRLRVGKRVFARILRAWATENRYGNVGTGEFIAFAEERSGQPLRGLFRRWLFRPGKP